jgi:hypothetical protein
MKELLYKARVKRLTKMTIPLSELKPLYRDKIIALVGIRHGKRK